MSANRGPAEDYLNQYKAGLKVRRKYLLIWYDPFFLDCCFDWEKNCFDDNHIMYDLEKQTWTVYSMYYSSVL